MPATRGEPENTMVVSSSLLAPTKAMDKVHATRPSLDPELRSALPPTPRLRDGTCFVLCRELASVRLPIVDLQPNVLYHDHYFAFLLVIFCNTMPRAWSPGLGPKASAV